MLPLPFPLFALSGFLPMSDTTSEVFFFLFFFMQLYICAEPDLPAVSAPGSKSRSLAFLEQTLMRPAVDQPNDSPLVLL